MNRILVNKGKKWYNRNERGSVSMKYLLVEYPKCSTCQKAKAWLETHGIHYVDRNIVTETPTYEELEAWIARSGKEISKFFNTSGLVYKEMGLKDKLPAMSQEEKIQLLASNGMLIKRPLVVSEEFVMNGFKEAEWEGKIR